MSHFTTAPRLVAAEGGYQEFVLRGGEHAVLAFSALAALLAIGVGFHLMRGVLAAEQGTPKMIEIAEAIQEGAAAYLPRQYLTIDRYVDWQSRTHKPLPSKALPTRTFTKAESMMFGGQTIDYAPLGQAHTDGDISIFFRDANVLVAGDVMAVGKYPIADYTSGGWLGGLLAATKTLLSLANAETRIVPGEGPVQTRADLQAQYDMLSASRDAFVKMMRQGMSADEMLAAGATRAFDARWGDPQLFVKTSYRGLWLHVREVGGIV